MSILNFSKKLFTTEELYKLGFKEEREGGYQYLMMELAGGLLVTGDISDDEPISNDDVWRVYLNTEKGKQLSAGDIIGLIEQDAIV